MFTTHYNGDDDINTIYKLLMAEPNARTQLARTVSITKQMIRTVIHSRARWDEYIPLWQVIKLQARYNSPLFASHGIDHSIRTAYYMQKIWPKCTPPMMWTALLHDVGYSEYDICRNCQRRNRNKKDENNFEHGHILIKTNINKDKIILLNITDMSRYNAWVF